MTAVSGAEGGLAGPDRVDAVLFDLDDTLFGQSDWLAGAWEAVATAAATMGVAPAPFLGALTAVAAEGSDRGGIIDRALDAVGAAAVAPAPLVAVFRSHRPARLDPYPGVFAVLASLRQRVPIGCVTDGDPAIQRGKLAALGLTDAFDVVVLSDELGREHRKPDPLPFRRAVTALGVDPARTVHVGDRPAKDVVGALAAGCVPVRVRTGEYADQPDDPAPWRAVADVVAAAALLAPLVGPGPRVAGAPRLTLAPRVGDTGITG